MHQTKSPKRVLNLLACGGVGTEFCFGKLAAPERLGNHPAFNWRGMDTERPAHIPSPSFLELRPDHLPDEPDARLLALLRIVGMPAGRYRQLKALTGSAGVSRLPALAFIAAMARLNELVSAIESDFKALSARVGGATATWLITASSGMGGTGAPSARVAGLAFRCAVEGLAPDARWIHLLVTGSVLPEHLRSRRTRALEHRCLLELQASMNPNAVLRVPGRRQPIAQPGPDFVWLVGSSAEAPRTLDEAADEVAAVLLNLASA